MPSPRYHFQALLSTVEPSPERATLASSLPGEVRSWLAEHEYQTFYPHTRLSGSYARSTAIFDIKDVDVLLFVPSEHLDRTPNAVLRELKGVLNEYPDSSAETSPQRRSVHLNLCNDGLHLDIVPVVAADGLGKPLLIPDRTASKWIETDPLGYANRLSGINQEYGGKVVPLVKLFKAWRDAQMTTRRPKSYVLEVMVLRAVEGEHIKLEGNGTAQNFTDLVDYLEGKYARLMDEGVESPRVLDPQSGRCITTRWERSHFETFMRRLRETQQAIRRSEATGFVSEMSAEWRRVFGNFWPSDETAADLAKAEAKTIQPGRSSVTSSGGVLTPAAATLIPSAPTKYFGDFH